MNVSKGLVSASLVAGLLSACQFFSLALGEDAAPAPSTAPAGSSSGEPAPAATGPAKVIATWPDGTNVSRQQTIDTRKGTMTQTIEQSKTADGYYLQRQRVWTSADGAPLRSQQATVSGTDANNFERQKIITLKDGRTIEHTYSQSLQDGTLQTTRSFSGPNGQNWTRDQTWTQQSDGTWVRQLPTSPTPPSATAPATTNPPSTAPVTEQPAQAKTGLLGGWGQSSKTRPSGFTMGAGRGNWGANSRGMSTVQPGMPESGASMTRRGQVESHGQGQSQGLGQGQAALHSATRSEGRGNH